LTRALLGAGARVRAVEKDDRLIPVLAQEFKKEISSGALEIVHGDVMEMPMGEILKGAAEKPSNGYKVIANIPYYITGALIRSFLSASAKPSLMVLMVQKEVAQRIVARDGKESVLSISVKAYAKPELVMNVARGNFFPAPNVDSAVIRLSNIQDPFGSAATESRFFEIVKAGFAQKRKKLISNLESVMPRAELEKRFAELGIDGNARAEDMTTKFWMSLARS
jgi:16S rRNA (adenine1518-N6/adenine1519-N6)-dimethyltransferase